jgi:hypothetical protein
MDLKVGIVAAVAALLVAFGAFGLGKTTDVRADITDGNVFIVGSHAIESTVGSATQYDCDEGTAPSDLIIANNPAFTPLAPYEVDPNELFVLFAGESIFICVNPTVASPGVLGSSESTGYSETGGTGIVDDGDVTYDSNDVGFFDQPSCTNPDADTRVAEWPDDACVNSIGVGTDQMEVQDEGNNLNTIIVRYTCGPIVALLRRSRSARTRASSNSVLSVWASRTTSRSAARRPRSKSFLPEATPRTP